MNETSVDSYLQEGCGRCELFQTPECKVHRWTAVLKRLRELMEGTGLNEEMKWGAPCYTLKGKNVVALSALKGACVLSFFKGAILADELGVLEAPGPNSRFVRYLKFTSVEEVEERRALAARLIEEAIEVERAGKRVEPEPTQESLPEELQARFAIDPALAEAFAALTPGRQRSHVLYVSGAKQSKTRVTRAERCAAKILAGKGYNER